MGWLTFLQALVQAAHQIMQFLNQRTLKKAGKDELQNEQLQEHIERIKVAEKANESAATVDDSWLYGIPEQSKSDK